MTNRREIESKKITSEFTTGPYWLTSQAKPQSRLQMRYMKKEVKRRIGISVLDKVESERLIWEQNFIMEWNDNSTHFIWERKFHQNEGKVIPLESYSYVLNSTKQSNWVFFLSFLFQFLQTNST